MKPGLLVLEDELDGSPDAAAYRFLTDDGRRAHGLADRVVILEWERFAVDVEPPVAGRWGRLLGVDRPGHPEGGQEHTLDERRR